jgi:UDP-N-acetylmuramoyl-L-alanyl-D-glutamate--2,6-diaminopimelate ligase
MLEYVYEAAEDLNFDNFASSESVWRFQDHRAGQNLFTRFSTRFDHKDLLERVDPQKFEGLFICNKVFSEIEQFEHWVVVDDEFWEDFQCHFLNVRYPIPSIPMLAITGTNGKTTTLEFIRQFAIMNNQTVLSLGTLGVFRNMMRILPAGLTTLNYLDLRKVLSEQTDGVDFVAMEVSSHGLHQKRVFKVLFDCAAWTNFSQDHLDYHKTMDAYFDAKALLLKYHLKLGGLLYVPETKKNILEKIGDDQRVNPIKVKKYQEQWPSFLGSDFNRENLSLAVSMYQKVFEDQLITNENIKSLHPPQGRMQLIWSEQRCVCIDFAHTPDALKNILRELRKTFADYQIWTLFGCGGDRDPSKRHKMGQVALELSDFCIVTSDNPRFEDPAKIISDIIKDFAPSDPYEVIESRGEAIEWGLEKMPVQTILLLAGKGHEEYIDENGVKIPFSETQIVKNRWGKM